MKFQGQMTLVVTGSENLCSNQCQFYLESADSCILFNIELDYEQITDDVAIPKRTKYCKDLFTEVS